MPHRPFQVPQCRWRLHRNESLNWLWVSVSKIDDVTTVCGLVHLVIGFDVFPDCMFFACCSLDITEETSKSDPCPWLLVSRQSTWVRSVGCGSSTRLDRATRLCLVAGYQQTSWLGDVFVAVWLDVEDGRKPTARCVVDVQRQSEFYRTAGGWLVFEGWYGKYQCQAAGCTCWCWYGYVFISGI